MFKKSEDDKKQFKANTIVFTKFGKDVEEDPEAVLRVFAQHCDWVLGQREKCPDTGRIHIQGIAWSKEPSRWGWLKGESYWKKKSIDPIAALDYVQKSETRIDGPWEFGERPSFNVKGQKLKNQADKNKILIEKDIVTLVNEGHISFTQVPTIIKAKNFWTMVNPGEAKDKEQNEWIYGKPGCGKTRFIRENYEGFYEKAQNKWWDGYKGQDVVFMDDFDKQGSCLGHHLKIWSDRYFGWPAETKGGTIQPNFKKLIITSNYTPEDIFGGINGDAELVAAIERRFRLGEMDDKGIIKWIK